MRSTIALVAGIAFSTAALAQVGTAPAENKLPANQTPSAPVPPSDAPQNGSTAPSTDDAPPADRADAPANSATPSDASQNMAVPPPTTSR